MNWKKFDIAVVRAGWVEEGKEYNVLGPAIFHEQDWVPVEGDDGDPTFYKDAALLKKERR